jgi:hypothetical protein
MLSTLNIIIGIDRQKTKVIVPPNFVHLSLFPRYPGVAIVAFTRSFIESEKIKKGVECVFFTLGHGQVGRR